MAIVTASYQVEYKSGGSWSTIPASSVIGVEGSGESASSDSGAGFGDTTTTACSIEVLRSAVAGENFSRLPVKVTFTVAGSSAQAFVGVVKSWSGDLDTVRWECDSLITDLPNRTKNLYSPLYYRRPVATKTTASSIEDPASGSYQAGLINWILWKAGLRPNEQAGSYPTADGYYSCEQAIKAPDWSWIAGEDGWEEALRLARAAGGQLYQGTDGVIRYKSPLSLVGTATKTYTLADFADISEDGDTAQYAATITAPYTPRRVQPTQEIINDTTPRVIESGASITVELEPQWPLYSVVLDGGTLKDKNITAAFFDGRVATYSVSAGYTTTTTIDAQRITVVITNNSSWNLQVTKIRIDGQPIGPGEAGTVTVGSGQPTKTLEDNPFVQTKRHAEALARMALAFYGTLRQARTMSGVVYDTARSVGETVNLTVSELGLSAAKHIVTAIRHSETGTEMEVTAIDATGIPSTADYWLVSSSAQSGTHKIAW